jgi:hypothetical protein
MATFNNLEALMKIAEEQAEEMKTKPVESVIDPTAIPDIDLSGAATPIQNLASNPITDAIQNLTNNPILNQTSVPDVLKAISNVDMSQALNQENINNVMDRIKNNPDEISRMIDNLDIDNPDVMEEARKLVQSGQGNKILKQMEKRGMNPKELCAQIKAQQKEQRALKTGSYGMFHMIVITATRQLRIRKVSGASLSSVANDLLSCSSAIEISCSRLARGVLKDKNVKAWYNGDLQGTKNNRASKLVGFPVIGALIISTDNTLITEKEFLQIEKELC